jgi:hypothetical protein
VLRSRNLVVHPRPSLRRGPVGRAPGGTLRWDGSGGWTLHKVGGDSFHVVEPEKVQTTVKTKADFGEVPFGQYAAAGL